MVYQLAEQDPDILDKFTVSTEREVGGLTLTRPLDFEEKRLYQVEINLTIIRSDSCPRLLSRLRIVRVKEK